MPSRIEIDDACFDVASAMLELTNCAERVAEFSILFAMGGDRAPVWLTGVVSPAPVSDALIECSRFRLDLHAVDALFEALTSRRWTVYPHAEDAMMHVRRRGQDSFRLSTSFGFVEHTAVSGGSEAQHRAAIDVTARLMGFHRASVE